MINAEELGLETLQAVADSDLHEGDLIELQEADIRLGLKRDGFIRSIIVVTRPTRAKKSVEHVLWIHPSWLRGFHPFCSHRGRSMRSYKDLDLLYAHCRDDWGYRGAVIIRLHDDPKIERLRFAAAQLAARRIAQLVGNEALLD